MDDISLDDDAIGGVGGLTDADGQLGQPGALVAQSTRDRARRTGEAARMLVRSASAEAQGVRVGAARMLETTAPGAMELGGDGDGVLDMKSDDGDASVTMAEAGESAAAVHVLGLGASDGASGGAHGGALKRATEQTFAYNQFLANTLTAMKEQVGQCKRQYLAASEHLAQATADFEPHRARLSRAKRDLRNARNGHAKAALAASTYLLSELPPPIFRNAMSFLVIE